MASAKIGRQGEAIALKYLLGKGYRLVRRNFYTRWGEIDLILWHRESKELIFVEVKTRSSTKFGYPEEAVDEHKLERIVKAADRYLQRTGYSGNYCFDIVSVELDYIIRKAKVRHLENVG